MSDTTDRKRSGRDRFNDLLRELRASAPVLRSPAELLETVAVPPDLVPALSSNRPELLRLLEPRAMDADEVAKLYVLIEVLVRTNATLVQHAQGVSALASIVEDSLRGVVNSALLLGAVASFLTTDEVSRDD